MKKPLPRRATPSLDIRPKADLPRYLAFCDRAGADAAYVSRLIWEGYDGPHNLAVRDRWYASVAKGCPDFGVYDGDWYLAELWFCWVECSRKHVAAIRDRCAHIIGSASNVLDLGCGAGWASRALSEVFPRARVFGTNIEGTTQHRVAKLVARGTPRVTLEQPPSSVDVMFASEYLEHFEDPVAEIRRAIEAHKPRAIILASAFGALAVGHFNSKSAGRRVGACLNAAGYAHRPFPAWNNRPKLWMLR